MNSNDFEKLGVFYLGKTVDLRDSDSPQELLLYDSKDLTTHAVVVGMTGSGKTGLCLGILEEAGLDHIPSIVIDPKGDIANLLLTFPNLSPEEFEPWVDPGQASREGIDPSEFAKRESQKWKNGLAKWGQDGDRIRRLREAVEMRVYTPGSTAGRPLTILKSFQAPGGAILEDSDAIRERISSAASGLLALLGIDADPIRSREHILISQLLSTAWNAHRDLDLGTLIMQIQDPPFQKVGIMDLNAFFPAKDRMDLAMTINNLLASPSFASWMEGEPLNIKDLLHNSDGKPCISILSIAHLNDAERMFFVTILLNEVLAWMRAQSGTSSLRALLYMDEVFGYFPPTRNPPSKQPMLTLMKQARAYGLGVVLATQNPVDLDYKGLSNAGTWFLGRLQTERDKLRVIDGLEGVAAQSGTGFNRQEIDRTLSGLGARKFLMNNVHDDQPVVFETRWAMSYLRGPLTRKQIQQLTAADRESALSTAADLAAPSTGHPTADTLTRPAVAETLSAAAMDTAQEAGPLAPGLIPESITQQFLEPNQRPAEEQSLVYRPALLGTGRLHFVKSGCGVDAWESRSFLQTVTDEEVPDPFWTADSRIDLHHFSLLPDAPGDARFVRPPAALQAATRYRSWEKELKDFLYRTQNLLIYQCKELPDHFSLPGETLGDFRVRLETLTSEYRDREQEKLRAKFATRYQSIRDEVDSAKRMLEKEKSQYRSSRLSSILNVGGTIMSAFLGRKVSRKTSTTVRSFNKASEQLTDVKVAEDKLESLINKHQDLDQEFNAAMREIEEKAVVANLTFDEILISPRKGDLAIESFSVCWVPFLMGSDGSVQAAY